VQLDDVDRGGGERHLRLTVDRISTILRREQAARRASP
jgi:hypothetical protein